VPRQPRSHLPDGTYHVTAQAVCGSDLFLDDDDRLAFLWLLGSVTTRFELGCRAYCLMGTHYHLVLQGRQEDLSVAMQQLNGRYAKRFNARHARRGHIFSDRYSAYIVRDEHHLEEACGYIAANPVKAGLCQGAADWPWTWIAGSAFPSGFRRAVPVPAIRAA
jgi:putative transposase